MNRVGLGLAIGAGYVLGRTKKMKLAFAVGTLVAGKRMHLSPRALAELAQQQLRDNPQFKEIGDQLREDLRGVGKAASGAMVERQLDALADRLHGRTAQMRDQLSDMAPETPDLGFEEGEYEEEDEAPPEGREEAAPERKPERQPEKKADDKPRAAKKAAKKAPAKKTPAKKAAAKKKPASAGGSGTRKTAAKKTAGARGAARSARARLPKGGGE
ncbi:DNA primase [Streptomyces sp. TRM68416]|uniref:DNA primase n=1 Tax=Streptomyces sp. TRM68416 TaxID=2758412 RepID=UPI001661C319|nr:DNA primase [Streptomyces sp. TRM68416]MBD0841627.1 DNA primase [Streptomyces sp. TRM68416]